MPTMHCIPVDDVIEHVPYDNCLCGPSTLMWYDEDGDLNFTEQHHSLDGREFREKKPEYEEIEGEIVAKAPKFKKGNTKGTKKKKNPSGPPASVLRSKSPKTPSAKKKGKGRKKK